MPERNETKGDPTANIPVDAFIRRYDVVNAQTVEMLRAFPTLCYLLGNSERKNIIDLRDNRQKTIRVLTEGSGMFGLKTEEEVMEWKGIFNHIMGSVRHINFLSYKLKNMTADQRQILISAGHDPESIDSLNPDLLGDFMFDSHAGRRRADEQARYKNHASPQEDRYNQNPTYHSYFYTMQTLRESGADPAFLELMRVENHEYEVNAARGGLIPDIFDNIYDYCDWTFGQQPTPLATRFEGLRATGRQPAEILDILQTLGTNFENTLKAAFGDNIYDQMASSEPFPGEIQIRTAYASSAGLTLAQIYPEFASRYAT